MKNKLFIIAALCAFALGLRAEEAKPASSYAVTMDFTYGTKYVFRGTHLAKDTLFPSVEVSAGPITAGVWSAQPIVDNIDNEIDFYVGYGADLSDGWSLDVGACLYYYPELDKSTGADATTFEPYVGVSGSLGGVSPGAYVYYDTKLEVLTVEGSIGYSVALEPAGASLDFSAVLGRADPKSGSSTTYYSLGAAVPFAISETGTITVGVNYTHNNIAGGDGYGKNSHFYGTIGLALGF